MLTPFRNEPPVDFSEDGPRQKMVAALKEVGSQLGQIYPFVICTECIHTDQATLISALTWREM